MALAFALAYGLLAGMGVPTIRTVLMIAVVLLARLSRRAVSVSHGLALAAVSIMLFDPLAVLADMKKIMDLKGRPLLLFAHEWSIRMTEERNEGLILSEFGRS